MNKLMILFVLFILLTSIVFAVESLSLEKQKRFNQIKEINKNSVSRLTTKANNSGKSFTGLKGVIPQKTTGKLKADVIQDRATKLIKPKLLSPISKMVKESSYKILKSNMKRK